MTDELEQHPAWLRLDDQYTWLDRTSIAFQRKYKWLRYIQLVVIGALPIAPYFEPSAFIPVLLAATAAAIEGVHKLNGYGTLWVQYRQTAEHLKRERALFLSSAGPYRSMTMEDRLVNLAERTEAILAGEQRQWVREAAAMVSEPSPKAPLRAA